MDYLVKDRLTGAVILVAVIVLLVPELLSGPKGPARNGGVPASNSSEEPQLRSYTINLADDAHLRADAPSGPAIPPAEVSSPVAASAGSLTEHTSEAPAAAHGDSASADSSPGMTPNTGSSVPEHAAEAAPARAASSNGSRGASSTAAHAVVTPGVHAANGTRGNPTQSSNSGWMVQLGVFASRENAERLAGQVRTRGLRASVSESGASGRRLFRVRVGPAPDRAAAQEMQARLRAAGRPAGTLIPPS